MPADGSQYLVTEQRNVTTRGDTSASTHSQTVSYDSLTDTVLRNLTHDKVVEQETIAHDEVTEYDTTDTTTTTLAANKVSTSDQEQIASGESESVRKSPPSLQLQFTVDMLGTTIFC